jgi:hypothetical protein
MDISCLTTDQEELFLSTPGNCLKLGVQAVSGSNAVKKINIPDQDLPGLYLLCFPDPNSLTIFVTKFAVGHKKS